MTRGDLVVIAFKGEYGSKPRPALVVQADEFSGTASVTVPRHGRYVDATIGRVDEASLLAVNLTMARFLGLAD